MKVLLVSDTHKNIPLLTEVLNMHEFDILVHLGDYYEDPIKAGFKKYCKTLYRVPGIYHPAYISGEIDAIDKLDFVSIPTYIVHSIDDISLTDIDNSIIFYGHTHIQKIEKVGSNLLINPGHLKLERDRGQSCSYIILEVEHDKVIVNMYEVRSGLKKKVIIKDKEKLELKIC